MKLIDMYKRIKSIPGWVWTYIVPIGIALGGIIKFFAELNQYKELLNDVNSQPEGRKEPEGTPDDKGFKQVHQHKPTRPQREDTPSGTTPAVTVEITGHGALEPSEENKEEAKTTGELINEIDEVLKNGQN